MDNLFTQQNQQNDNFTIKTVPSSLPRKLPPISQRELESKQKSKKQMPYSARYKLTFPSFALNQEEEVNLQIQIKETQKQKIKNSKKFYNSVVSNKLNQDQKNQLKLDMLPKRQQLSPLKPMKASHSRKSSLTKISILTPSSQQNIDVQAEIERIALFQEAKFQEAAAKQLKDLSCYDCWDDQKTGQQWVEECKMIEGPHALSPVFVDYSYIWVPVFVLGFNQYTQRYLIQVELTGQKKEVQRLSLQYFTEDEQQFNQRLEQCKKLQRIEEQYLRQTGYIQSIADEKVSELRKEVKSRLLQLAVEACRGIQIDKYINTFRQLIQVVDEEYKYQMKKCFVLREVTEKENEQKFKRLKLHLEILTKEIPERGTLWIPDYSSNSWLCPEFLKMKKEFTNKIWINNAKYVKVCHILMNTSHEFKQHKLLNTNLQELSVAFPIKLVQFHEIQKKHHDAMIKHISRQWRQYLINVTQEEMSAQYHFFSMDVDGNYSQSELHKLLKKLDLMMNTQMSEFVKLSVLDWVQFLKNFSNLTVDKIRHQVPLIKIKISQIGNEEKKKKSKKKKKEDKNKEEEEQNQQQMRIDFNPGEKDLEDFFTRVIRKWIIGHINGLNKLECDMVPFMNIPKDRICDLDEEIPWIKESLEDIVQLFEFEMEEPRVLLEKYKQFEFIANTNIKLLIQDIFKEKNQEEDNKNQAKIESESESFDTQENPDQKEDKANKAQEVSIKDVQDQIQKYLDAEYAIMNLSNDQEDFCLFRIICKEIKEKLANKSKDISQAILMKTAEKCRNLIGFVIDEMDQMCKKLEARPENEEQLVELKNLVKRVPNRKKELVKDFETIEENIDLLKFFSHDFPEVQIFWKTRMGTFMLDEALRTGEATVDTLEEKFKEDLEKQKRQWGLEVDNLKRIFERVQKFGNYDQASVLCKEVNDLKANLDDAMQKLSVINQKEGLFDMPLTDKQDLQDLMNDFEPFFKLWNIVDDFKTNVDQWKVQEFHSLNPDIIVGKVEQQFRDTNYFIRKLQKFPDAIEVSTVLKGKIEEFQKIMPLISNINTKAFKQQHWDKVMDQVEIFGENRPLHKDPNLTLTRLINEFKLDKHLDAIKEISDRATKEHREEERLEQMKKSWDAVKLELAPYKGAEETWVLKTPDEIYQMLDDQIATTQSMKVARHVTEKLKKDVEKWESNLQYIQDCLDEWLKCQRSWMYLKPIMSSEDIQQAIGNEFFNFQIVDQWWKQTMQEKVNENDLLTQINPQDRQEQNSLLKQIQDKNKNLEGVLKALNSYMDQKRRSFPRFFFLSDGDLLEILSKTKDPHKVQPHLSKCFEAINRIKFNSSDCVVSMISPEKEEIQFLNKIDVNKKEFKGYVEQWMGEIQNQMFNAIKDQIAKSIQDYQKTDRVQWALKWPGQVVLAVDQIYWTQEVEESIANNDLRTYADKLDQQLSGIVQMVRGQLQKLERATTSAMVVIDVHARDVVSEMVKQKVTDINDFKWLSQLRYYWTIDHKDMKLLVKMVNAQLNYGFEYLGNSTRLVITPLTDRCYRTLMGAFHLQYGGAPEGPAGTGKTESVKDLAKAMAIKCVVFNCSDGMNASSMAKFFKGLIASGSWCCFDEFNRIELEVLSVIAMQVFQIQNAIRQQLAGEAKKKKIIFDDTELDLQISCAINITMNPGYAGRSDLPDNLKALFRPCAMMVPDYALISEIVLYSFGFQDARNIAAKIVNALKLSSEQLSTQDHYDFGMRAVKAILTAAGQLKMQYQQEDESKLALRALIDVNVPKFTANDIPLFEWITADLFPNVTLPQREYDQMLRKIFYACSVMNLQPTEIFKKKCVQLFETICVRHGMMLVGQTMSGKSKVIKTLGQSLEEKVELYYTNPKSVTQDQLYGNLDVNSKEWNDGVLAILVRNTSKDESNNWKWIVFDGPVDAIWIENMNTVLDDNKMLCLTSGETIPITSTMRLIFEVEDLRAASPATVSRCGMIYLEPSQLGWEVFLTSYFDRINEQISNKALELYLFIYKPLFPFVRKYCKCPQPVGENEMVYTALQIFDVYLGNYEVKSKIIRGFDRRQSLVNMMRKNSLIKRIFEQQRDNEKEEKGENEKKEEKKDELPKDIETQTRNFVFFSVIWGVGGVIDEKDRQKFQQFMFQLLEGVDVIQEYKLIDVAEDWEPKQIPCRTPANKSVYDVLYEANRGQWVGWDSVGQEFQVPGKEVTFTEIFIPTKETYRMEYQIKTLSYKNRNVLFIGSTGTSKTVSIEKTLRNFFKNEKWTYSQLAFSAQTTAQQTQRIVEGNLEKRRKINIPAKNKRMIIFVDDLNMPQKEKYGAQPPIELLRQWMDYNGWYDLDSKEFRECQNLQFIGAMGPPGGGRNSITQRYIRHFCKVYVEPFSTESLIVIYGSIMDWFLLNKNFPKSIQELKLKVINATIDTFQRIQKELRPTPAKSHYTYNLRDISKVFQGMSQTIASSIADELSFTRLWLHECFRVFCDRLINQQDRNQFKSMIQEVLFSHFKKTWESAVTTEQLIFASLTDNYLEYPLKQFLKDKMEEALRSYNEESGSKMDLVLFQEAIEHVTKILRVLKQPRGHCLLVGVGGSGLRSLTKLATHIAEYQLKQIEVTKNYNKEAWNEDLIDMFYKAGALKKETVFLISDSQLAQESFLEDINSILNYGIVPNIMPPEKINDIQEAIQEDLNRRPDIEDFFQLFVEFSKQNLHVVFRMSPIGDDFRRRLRMFPSLVNCTTINWFLPWNEEALRSVAWTFLQDQHDLENKKGIINICVDMQERVTQLCLKFKQELNRYYYVTPTSYLELIGMFQKLLKEKKGKDYEEILRYKNGVQKLEETNENVQKLAEKLEKELIPQCIEAAVQTEKLMESLKIQQAEADEKKRLCEIDKAKASEIAQEASEISQSCQKELDNAMPIYNKAVAALDTIDRKDLQEMKALPNPPEGCKLTMEVICLMKGIKPKMVKNPDGRGSHPDYWEPAKAQLLNNPNQLLKDLKEYDKDNISPEVVAKVTPYTKDPRFEPNIIKKASNAAFGLCEWVRAMIIYDDVLKIVRPKQAALAEALEKKRVAETELAVKEAELQGVLDLLKELQDNYDKAVTRKKKLEEDRDQYDRTIKRATKLLAELKSEKTRWAQQAEIKSEFYQTILGDVLMSAGVIAYLGAFFKEYREQAIENWQKLMEQNNIIASKHFTLESILGIPLEINQWKVNDLPSDSFSIDNAIILKYSTRWPLMIDPQGQANNWIKRTFQKSNKTYKIVRLSNDNFMREIRDCVRTGFQCLIENVGQKFDPSLAPLLNKELTMTGLNEATINLGEDSIPFDFEFQLFITTKLPKPHYSPEICVRVTILNFTTTEKGLEEQLLTFAVAKEEAQVEENRQKQIEIIAKANQKQIETELTILRMLNESKGDILQDENLLNTIETSSKTAKAIAEDMKNAEKIMEKVQVVRAKYTPLAIRASQLFFVLADLANVENMYQFSLEFYKSVFLQAMNTKVLNVDRVEYLIQKFTSMLYSQVSRGLFEKHKLLFSFNMCTKIMIGQKKLEQQLLRFLATGGTLLNTNKPNPTQQQSGSYWLTDKQWAGIIELSQFSGFYNFDEDFIKNVQAWEKIWYSQDPINEEWPNQIKDKLNYFKQTTVIRIIRPDKAIQSIQQLIKQEIGEEYINPPPFELEVSYSFSDVNTPLIFILSPGADPMSELEKLVRKKGILKKFNPMSLGDGQAKKAEKAIGDGIDNGKWVCLQNCHLYQSWMNTLERKVEEIDQMKSQGLQVQPDFRLWLTSSPSEGFPTSVLQIGIKITNEPPKGLRNNLKRCFLSFDPTEFESCTKPMEYKTLLYGLSFFHALILERRKFGPIGWNIQYEFSQSDLAISVSQLRIFLNEQEQIPWEALRYMVAEANYGGRVTDPWDRRCINTILSTFYNPEIFQPNYKFSSSGIYKPAPESELERYFNFIDELPYTDRAEVFCMHENAEVTSAINDTNEILNSVLSLLPRTSSSESGLSPDELIKQKAKEILQRLPILFDIEAIYNKYPDKYNQSMNTVLTQEVIRFNKLLGIIRNSLDDFQKAIDGLVIMSADLENVYNALYDNKLPALWKANSYPSLKLLGSWINDFLQRLQFIQNWIDNGPPAIFWLSGFYFTQSFLTGTLQNYSRKHVIAIDKLTFEFTVQKEGKRSTVAPEDGCYVDGLFLEGAQWNDKKSVLDESSPKLLFTQVPVILLSPLQMKEKIPQHTYQAPVYKTSQRHGTLSTTGHSTNFILPIDLPMKKEDTDKHWIKRGVALLTQLDY